MEASEPKWVNPDDIQYGVNSLRLEGLQLKLRGLEIQHYQMEM